MWVRWLRSIRRLRSNEIQAKVPMVVEPTVKDRFLKLIPVRDPEIYPLLICDAVGLVLLGTWAWHLFAKNPEVCLSRQRRQMQSVDRFRVEDAEQFAHHHKTFAYLRPNPVNAELPVHEEGVNAVNK